MGYRAKHIWEIYFLNYFYALIIHVIKPTCSYSYMKKKECHVPCSIGIMHVYRNIFFEWLYPYVHRLPNTYTIPHICTDKRFIDIVDEMWWEIRTNLHDLSDSLTQDHWLINYIDTKAKFCHLKQITCKGTLRQVFIRVYRLEIQSIMLVFSAQLCELLPL